MLEMFFDNSCRKAQNFCAGFVTILNSMIPNGLDGIHGYPPAFTFPTLAFWRF